MRERVAQPRAGGRAAPRQALVFIKAPFQHPELNNQLAGSSLSENYLEYDFTETCIFCGKRSLPFTLAYVCAGVTTPTHWRFPALCAGRLCTCAMGAERRRDESAQAPLPPTPTTREEPELRQYRQASLPEDQARRWALHTRPSQRRPLHTRPGTSVGEVPLAREP